MTDSIKIEDEFEFVECHSGQKLLANRQICENLYYLKDGLVQCNNYIDSRVLWFESNNNFFTVPDSFLNHSPTSKELLCVEPCEIYQISRKELLRNCKNSVKWANWWAYLLEQEYLKLNNIYQNLFYKSASDRYAELLKAIPDIELRVPLKDIASFLGISQVSLSRIRAGKQ